MPPDRQTAAGGGSDQQNSHMLLRPRLKQATSSCPSFRGHMITHAGDGGWGGGHRRRARAAMQSAQRRLCAAAGATSRQSASEVCGPIFYAFCRAVIIPGPVLAEAGPALVLSECKLWNNFGTLYSVSSAGNLCTSDVQTDGGRVEPQGRQAGILNSPVSGPAGPRVSQQTGNEEFS